MERAHYWFRSNRAAPQRYTSVNPNNSEMNNNENNGGAGNSRSKTTVNTESDMERRDITFVRPPSVQGSEHQVKTKKTKKTVVKKNTRITVNRESDMEARDTTFVRTPSAQRSKHQVKTIKPKKTVVKKNTKKTSPLQKEVSCIMPAITKYSDLVGTQQYEPSLLESTWLKKYVRNDLTNHVKNWPAETIEKETEKCLNSCSCVDSERRRMVKDA